MTLLDFYLFRFVQFSEFSPDFEKRKVSLWTFSKLYYMFYEILYFSSFLLTILIFTVFSISGIVRNLRLLFLGRISPEIGDIFKFEFRVNFLSEIFDHFAQNALGFTLVYFALYLFTLPFSLSLFLPLVWCHAFLFPASLSLSVRA